MRRGREGGREGGGEGEREEEREGEREGGRGSECSRGKGREREDKGYNYDMFNSLQIMAM